MKKIKVILILTLLFSVYLFISAYSYVSAISDNLYNSIFRLHVIANSNSEEDQALKYLVRDNLLNYLNSYSEKFCTKEDVVNFVREHKNEFKQIAEKTVSDNGFNYSVNVDIGNFEFPTKTYGDISFPAGCYDALRVEIGSSTGKNWWCVMFPPLCFVDTTIGIVPDSSKESLEENLSSENFSIISESNNANYALKFKIIELFERTGLITAKNNNQF